MPEVTVAEVTQHLEVLAPRLYQESYDNCGLITGNLSWAVKGILVTLDCTEQVVVEAAANGCNMVIAHHPILFNGLKQLTGSSYVERALIAAIKHEIAIYALHTNLDNAYAGVNKKIADKLGLTDLRILAPKKGTLLKLVTFIPKSHTKEVLSHLHKAGAGNVGDYSNCSFRVTGTGTFTPSPSSIPFVGKANQSEVVEEDRVEVILPRHLESLVMEALRQSHPYEEVAYYLTALENTNQGIGSGMIGDLPTPVGASKFLARVKEVMKVGCIRHTSLVKATIKRVAIGGGASSFLLKDAIRSGADIFISSDFKYHEFFDADGEIIIADIGHYESEQFTSELIGDYLREKFVTFAVNFSKSQTNPVSYL